MGDDKDELFKCKYCQELVKWDTEGYWYNKNNGLSIEGMTPTLNPNGTRHTCGKKAKIITEWDDILGRWGDRIDRIIQKQKLSFIYQKNPKHRIYLNTFIKENFYKNELGYVFLDKKDKRQFSAKKMIMRLFRERDIIVVGEKRLYLITKESWEQNRIQQKTLF